MRRVILALFGLVAFAVVNAQTISPASQLVIRNRADPDNPPFITTTTIPNATEDTSCSATMETQSGVGRQPFTWSIRGGSVPTGSSLNTSTGVISGTCSAAGAFSFTIRVVDALGGAHERALTWTVDASASSALCTDASTKKYVRAGASGTASGDNWTDAYTALPGTLTRGTTYCVADGAYSAYTFDDAVSGTTTIQVVKATTADHGTETGWVSTYGDGQAVFTGETRVESDDWVIDGQVGGGPGSWRSGHGFKFQCLTACGPVVFANNDNVSLRHVEILGNGDDGDGAENDCVNFYPLTPGATNWTISYAWCHQAGRTAFWLASGPVTWEYSWFGRFEGNNEPEHAETVANWGGDLTIRWSVLTHCEGTGGIMVGMDSGAMNHTVNIYGNIFVPEVRLTSPGTGEAWTACSHGLVGYNLTDIDGMTLRLYNNTFVDTESQYSGWSGSTLGTLADGTSAGSAARCNYWYNSGGSSGGAVNFNIFGTNADNHFNDSGTASGTNSSTSSGNPFTGWQGEDFSLTAGTTACTSLGSPYNVDMFGNTRGADGTWDRGAVEFVASMPVPSVFIALTHDWMRR